LGYRAILITVPELSVISKHWDTASGIETKASKPGHFHFCFCFVVLVRGNSSAFWYIAVYLICCLPIVGQFTAVCPRTFCVLAMNFKILSLNFPELVTFDKKLSHQLSRLMMKLVSS
jgi:hypothetical protein